MKLNSQEILDKLNRLNGWKLEDNAICKMYLFKDFAESMKFVNEVAEMAEEMDHHPDIFIQYNRVTLTLSTHSAGGITEKDFELAARIDWIK